MLRMVVVDREAVDLDRRRGVEHARQRDLAAVERHRGVEDLEGRALLVDAEGRAVEQRLVGDGLGLVRVVGRQRGHGEDLAVGHVHHDGGGADRRELLHRPAELFLDHALQAEIDRQLHGLAALQALVEVALDAGQTGVVDAVVADDVRAGRALRIDAPLLGLELEARDAEAIDQEVLARREAPLDPDEALVAVELLLDLLVLDLRQGRDDLARGIRRIDQQVRVDEGRHHRHRGREHHAVAVDDIGTLGLDRAAAGCDTLRRLGAVAQQRDVAHAQADRARTP